MAGLKTIAVDLGGTYLRVALLRNNKILKYMKRKTPKEKNSLIKELMDSISSLMDKDVKGIGIACVGPLKEGVIKNPPNLSLRNFNLKKVIENKFHKKTRIENDANCVALAESKFGCKKKNFIVLTLGTGLGGGIMINGELYKGKGYGGELGHIILDNGQYFEDLWKKRKFLIKDLLKKRDRKNKKILNRVSMYLGQGIASLINIFDPEVVILSGGAREAGQVFLNMIKKQAEKYVMIPNKPDIRWTKLKHPGILGASLLVS